MAHRFKWDDLQFVLSVAENGSLSAAARKLGVNHATVLRRITAFEKNYGVNLFERKPSGYLLTAQSKYIISTLQSIQKSVSSLERSFSGLGSPFQGRIRITSTDTICQEFLTPHVHMLSMLHPKLEIELLSTNYRLDLADLEADITIRPTMNLPEELTGEIIGSLQFGIFATPAYWQQNQSSNFLDHNWLGVSDPLIRSPVGKWQEKILGNQVTFRSDSFITLRQLAELGMGSVILPWFVGNSSDKLSHSPTLSFEEEIDIWVATHNDLVETPRIQAIMRYFIDVFKENRDLFSGQKSIRAAE
jgi:DNA-binding transcriptional LysR family regulator